MMLEGGCLCGAITWKASAAPRSVHHCHCSMCRKWMGGAFATVAWFPRSSVQWRGAQPLLFRSFPIAVRSHCNACGTPLYLAYDGKDELGPNSSRCLRTLPEAAFAASPAQKLVLVPRKPLRQLRFAARAFLSIRIRSPVEAAGIARAEYP
jgi:hypothetical protein